MLILTILCYSFFNKLALAWFFYGIGLDGTTKVNVDPDQEYFMQNPDSGLQYGIWSRYNPLQKMTYLGKVGLFDSNCIHSHNAVSQNTKLLTFINYICFDYQNQQIINNIKFYDSTNQEFLISASIKKEDYENVWYYFSFLTCPYQQILQIYIFQSPSHVILSKELAMGYPFREGELVFTFGGGINMELMKYSYFPGTMFIWSEFLLDEVLFLSPEGGLVFALFDQYRLCTCLLNSQIQIIDSLQIKNFNKMIYQSENPNCDYFQLAGWVKIHEILSGGGDVSYKLIKLTTDSQNKKLTDDNLSPFNLIYFLSNSGNKIIFTTYSYTFPTVNIDFSSNPFLITYEFDISNDIYLWHSFSAELTSGTLAMKIEFHEESYIYTYYKEVPVTQFHTASFQMQFGNLWENADNYLNLELNKIQFSNCAELQFENQCHFSCATCNGPKQTNCLSCSIDSNRLFLSELRECVCPYDSTDDNLCLTLDNFNLLIFLPQSQTVICPYGYFEVDSGCYQCPEIVNQQQINCLECVLNPQDWINMLFCFKSLISTNSQTYRDIDYGFEPLYFIFDGYQVEYCQTCTSECLNEECIFESMEQVKYLQTCELVGDQTCYSCNDKDYCQYCELQHFRLICTSCINNFNLENGICKNLYSMVGNRNCMPNCRYCRGGRCYSCYLPYYLNHDNSECKLCSIMSCQYCFEYLTHDRKQSTLYKSFEVFQSDDLHDITVGCSLCFEGFNFDFTSGKCIKSIPLLFGCLRSYTDQTGVEVCLLAEDFNIAPAINNCQTQINNCEQCILTPNQFIKCIKCAFGYKTLVAGYCTPCDMEHSVSCAEEDYNLFDFWVQSIQSFMMQFTPDSYFYPMSTLYSVETHSISCIDGYKVTKIGDCQQDCDANCLDCVDDENNSNFICNQCPSNYYGQMAFSIQQNTCLICPVLCLACQIRSEEEILLINPYFVADSSNIIYTYQCLKAINDQKVKVDPELKVAKYCFEGDCDSSLKYQFSFMKCEGGIIPLNFEGEKAFLFFNQKGVTNLLITMNISKTIIQTEFCILYIGTIIKQFVFSLQFTYLEVIGNNFTFTSVLITSFDSVLIRKVRFLSDHHYLYFSISNDNFPIDLFIEDCIFEGIINNFKLYEIKLTIFRDLKLRNVQLNNFNLKDSTWLRYISNLDEKQISINQFTIYNCSFDNITLFSFIQYSAPIIIEKLIITNSNFSNSTFILLNQILNNQYYLCKLNEIQFVGCIFKNSTFINNHGNSLQVTNLIFENNTFIDSTLMVSQGETTLSEIIFITNRLQSTIFFYSTKQIDQNTNFNANYLQIMSTLFSNSTLFRVYQDNEKSILVNLFLTNITHSALENSENSNNLAYLYDISSSRLEICNVTISDSNNLPYFRVYSTNLILMSTVLFVNQKLNKISPGLACLVNLNKYPVLLFVQGFSSIIIKNISIINQYSIDYSLIQIESDFLYQPNFEENITLSSINFSGNILLKQKLGNIFSLLAIYSGRFQIIFMENLRFEENFFHQLNDDPSYLSASLIYVDSIQSKVGIDNSNCVSNGLTNSSYTFLSIKSLSININNISFKNSNSLPNNIWKKYYQLLSFDFHSNDILDSQIQQIFSVRNKGAFQLVASTLEITNAIFSNILAQASAVLHIITQGQGIVTLTNISVIQASILLSQTLETDGCISVYSTNSLLNISLQNIYFQEVNNRLGPAIVTIVPSERQNYLNFTNITIINCFSLFHSVLTIEFFEQSAKSNFIFISYLNYQSTELGWKNYLNSIVFPSATESHKMTSDNALINLKQCSITLDNFYITGMLIQQIILINDALQLFVQNFRAENIEIFFPFILLQFEYSLSRVYQTVLHNCYFKNIIQVQNRNEIINKTDEQSSFVYYWNECQIKYETQKYQSKINLINSLTSLLNQNIGLTGSFISIAGISISSKILFSNINLSDNDCIFCTRGMISIQVSSPSVIIKIDDLKCYQNNISSFGCLVVKSDIKSDQSINSITITNSIFLKNTGNAGSGIYSENATLKISNCVFLKNNGSNLGGAIYMKNANNNFRFIKSKIIQNYASTGGGIFFEGQNYLTSQNFIQSLLFFNKAELSDNLVEMANHLELMINNKKHQSIYSAKDAISILQIHPYECLEQGKVILANNLMVPSNQKIQDYIFFSTKELLYKSYIRELVLIYKNSINELLEGNSDLECQILSRTYSIANQQPTNVSTFTEIQKIKYDSKKNGFDISQVTFRFDPYSAANMIYQIKFKCQSINGGEILQYQINARSFKCQLGEFYINEGCSICEPNQGFYSVTYNATKCSIFDKTKFQNITSNQIQLMPGYWRPNYLSDITEKCFKNQNWCVGGWAIGDNICYSGHIGGLCEECDIYNTRGDEKYFKQGNSVCISCENGSLIQFFAITLWYVKFVFFKVFSFDLSNVEEYQKFKQIICKFKIKNKLI